MGKLKLTLDIIIKEVSSFQDYLVESENNQLGKLNHKMDTILMGPDYEEGRTMMNGAKKDFESRV